MTEKKRNHTQHAQICTEPRIRPAKFRVFHDQFLTVENYSNPFPGKFRSIHDRLSLQTANAREKTPRPVERPTTRALDP